MATSADSPFIGADGNPALVECAVLFFDLLGVSAMAQGAAAETELLRFNETIRQAFPYPIGVAAAAEDRTGAYPTAVFSDSVVAAIPIQQDLPASQAIFQLALQVALLQTELATTQGYFARGAITLDRFHFYDGLIFGPALVEAVGLERTVALDPRVVLSPGATAALLTDSLYIEAPVLVDEDGTTFVDYLNGAFDNDLAIDLSSKLEEHRKVVATQLGEHATNHNHWAKYRWIAEYHNAICRNRELLLSKSGLSDLLIDSIHGRRRFESLAPAGLA